MEQQQVCLADSFAFCRIHHIVVVHVVDVHEWHHIGPALNDCPDFLIKTTSPEAFDMAPSNFK